MVEIDLPYDKQVITAKIPAANFAGKLVSQAAEFKNPLSEIETVERSLDEPIGSPKLEELARGKHNIVIISSDHTRPVPSHIITPILLRRLRSAAPTARIRILVATGFHRPSTHEELVNKYGEEIVANEEIVMHYSQRDEDMTKIGQLPSGGDLIVNKVATEADLLISEGFIESHFFAGFSGGRKAVLPGISSYKTIMANHSGEFINDQHSRTGNLQHNLIHQDMVFAAKAVHLQFILNVVLDEDKKIIGSFAGDLEKAHRKGTEFVASLSQVEPIESDITISTNGGYPLDQNIYQAVKGMTSAEATNKQNGTIIMVAGCRDGHGGEGFFHNIADVSDPKEFLEQAINTPRLETVPDQWTSQILARILVNHHVIMVSDLVEPNLVTKMHMELAKSLDEALTMAYQREGQAAKVTVIPDGLGVIVKRPQ
ncbi:MAG: nickel-dependent lactate racemase [Liquorilactobacillus nagelii]|jgi:nickel-dependent lactate racemase|uniref:Lactate racemization operon protein LarA n=1 Tax=Liquorilactobacillus nagelii TaxID=82688 RepID=A0A3S6QYL8_9LACO|nr:nickel-dependent lactate racemase [Liquorilactobacillus nagelii]AUJ32849.1 lactate racemization operon protein LarA [Liquorilactobacillus nagelii]MCC7616407.1 lactate racemization operon protein LarA [Liquorilactobacillus nagelii]MCI1634004.1 nickel-dependent lactate racemase [Liquorilactobacillus nagelii]MCI1699786.1 nickel-dependent lactate racemase [Liquorilactobacillus nagelii]MCP9315165.1 nickel-dependent lactate racemase [Liquorilactobacillus nagelii]